MTTRLAIALAAATLAACMAIQPGPMSTPTDRLELELSPLDVVEFWIVPAPTERPATSTGPVRLEDLDLVTDTHGPLASFHVRQRFVNTSSEPADLEYRLPIPSNALLGEFSMRIGDRHLRGIVLPREDAEEMYDAARDERAAVHLARTRNGAVLDLAQVAPENSVEVELEYVHGMLTDGEEYEWVFDAPAWNAANQLTVRGRLDLEGPISLLVTSPPALQTSVDGDAVTFAYEGPPPARALRIRFRADSYGAQCFRARSSTGGDDYGLSWTLQGGAGCRGLELYDAYPVPGRGGKEIGVLGRYEPGGRWAVVRRPLELAWAALAIDARERELAGITDPEKRRVLEQELRDLALARGLVTSRTSYAVVDARR